MINEHATHTLFKLSLYMVYFDIDDLVKVQQSTFMIDPVQLEIYKTLMNSLSV